MVKHAVSAVMILITTGAHSAENPSMSIFDFFVDGRSHMGRTVTVQNCHVANAFVGGADCQAIYTDDLGAHWRGTVILDSTIDRESLRRALRMCSGVLNNPGCAADVTGTVIDFHGRLGFPNDPTLGLEHATIHWLDDPK